MEGHLDFFEEPEDYGRGTIIALPIWYMYKDLWEVVTVGPYGSTRGGRGE